VEGGEAGRENFLYYARVRGDAPRFHVTKKQKRGCRGLSACQELGGRRIVMSTSTGAAGRKTGFPRGRRPRGQRKGQTYAQREKTKTKGEER